MDRDGTNDGYDLALTSAVSEAVSVPVIASGGAGKLEHLAQALQAGADAALCASIFHYGQYTIPQAKKYLDAAGIAVRASEAAGVSGTHAIRGTEEVIERLGSLPGGPELLAQAGRREDIALVGGAVRDLLLGAWPRELDVTVASDSAGLARALARLLASERPDGHAVEPTLHERFGTASVAWDYGRIDIAELRTESYRRPVPCPMCARAASRRTSRGATSPSTRSRCRSAVSGGASWPGRGCARGPRGGHLACAARAELS